MKNFEHIDATTVEEAIAVLRQYGGTACITAGGTDILGLMKDNVLPEYPQVLVNIKNIPDMSYIKEESGVLKIGALTLLQDIAENATVKANYAALAQAAGAVGCISLREMGTLGGNLCQKVRCWYYRSKDNRFDCFRKGGSQCFALTGDNRYNAILGAQGCWAVCPSDTAIALTALGATVVTNSRSIPIAEFYTSLSLALESGEIVTEIQIPSPASGTKQSFSKFTLRKSLDFALTSVATVLAMNANTVIDARIVLGGVAPSPYRATGAEEKLKGNAITEALAQEASEAALKNAIALSKNAYMIPIAKTVIKRALIS